MKMRSAVPVLIVVLLASFWVQAQVRDYRPVTEAMLRNPAAGDWLNWRRTDNAWGYSPLERAVQDLRTARSGGSVEIVRVD